MKQTRLLVMIGLLGLLGILAVPERPAWAQPLAQAPGGEIAYVRQGDVFLHDLTSGQDRRLTQSGQAQADTDLRWAPDGRLLLLLTYGQSGGDALLTVATGQVQGLPDDSSGVVWTPDGQALIGGRGSALVRLAAPAYSPAVLTTVASQDQIGEPAVASDGSIYYLHRVVDAAMGSPATTLIERVALTGGTATQVHDTRNPGGICELGGLAVAGADWLVWPTLCSHVKYADLVNLHTGADTTLNEHVPGLTGCEDVKGWAHTHAQLAVLQDAPCPYSMDENVVEHSSLIVVDNPVAPRVRQLVALGTTRLGALDWSPDDQWIAYTQYPAAAPAPSIAVVSAAGGAPRLVIPDGHSPAWRPAVALAPPALPGMPRTGQDAVKFWSACAVAGLVLAGLGSYLRCRIRVVVIEGTHGRRPVSG